MNVSTVYRTVRHLRLTQIFARVRFRARRVRVGTIAEPIVADMIGPWVSPAPRRGEHLGGLRFRLIGQLIDAGENGSWNPPGRDKLLLYHLHYMDVLNAPGGIQDAQHGAELIERWIADNKASQGNGWEPYPLSLRIVNWIKWHIKGNQLGTVAKESLFLQTRALAQQIEYHLLANHLLANAKALYFAGLFFEGFEAEEWKGLGARILEQEFQEQVLSDGGHFELSPMYHAIITEDLLDVINISRAYGAQSFHGLDTSAKNMLDWLALMTHPDGELAYFNDATQGVAASLADLQDYARRFGIDCKSTIPNGINYLPASGYVRYQEGCTALLADVGRIGPDYQPGHAHCDLLSFELSIGPQRYLVNSGISTYNADKRRHAERATASHNTVAIASAEQSEIWSAFRVGRRARPIDVDIGPQHVQAAHDGYGHCGVIHRRRFVFLDNRIEIEDVLESETNQDGTAHFHFHPDITPLVTETYVDVEGARLTFRNAKNVELLDYNYCSGFNIRRPAKKLAVAFEQSLATSIDYENSIHYR